MRHVSELATHLIHLGELASPTLLMSGLLRPSLLLLSLELSDTKVYEPQIRAFLGTAAHFYRATTYIETTRLSSRLVSRFQPAPRSFSQGGMQLPHKNNFFAEM